MENVIISNPNNFNQIKAEILKKGINDLFLITDFGKTLTQITPKAKSSIESILRSQKYLPKEFNKQENALLKIYYPIETNPNIPLNEKIKSMKKWWEKSSNLLVKFKFNKQILNQIINLDKIKFRLKVPETLKFLNKNKIPLIILSANYLGSESLNKCLRFKNILFPNIHMISNEYEWDENGTAIKYIKPSIHPFNKNGTSIKKESTLKAIKNRKNIILLGDSLDDVKMIKGFKYKNLLKIGFLNSNIETNLEEYKKHFDIIIINNSSMDFVYNLLKELK